jgi:hypothetical protein
MNSETRALIDEAREWPRDGINEGRLINALADALEGSAVSTPEPVRHISDKRASGMEPTDEDERDALATILATWRDDSPEEWAIDMYRDAADAILAAGFSRQVVSEPEPEMVERAREHMSRVHGVNLPAKIIRSTLEAALD